MKRSTQTVLDTARRWPTLSSWIRGAKSRSFGSNPFDDENRRRNESSRQWHADIHSRRRLNSLGSSSLRPFFITSSGSNQYAYNNHQQLRHASWLPEAFQSFSIWGGSGYMLKVFHDSLHL